MEVGADMSNTFKLNPDALFRGWDIINPNDLGTAKITLIGAGGIGSHVGIMLSRMGLPFTVYDGDSLELHNLSNQLYPYDGIGKNKALLLKEECARIGLEIEALPEFFVEQALTDIVISALDSQEARRKVWKQIKKQKKTNLYIDGRMGGEVISIYAIDPKRIDINHSYEEILKAIPDHDPCTARAIAYNLFGCACFIGKILQSYLKGLPYTNELHLDLRSGQLLRGNWEKKVQ